MARARKTAELKGSPAARKAAVVVLEALSGVLSTAEAGQALGVSLSRYYQLEARALEGMLQALEPRPRGPQKTAESELKALKAEKRELERELRRHRSLLRAAQRSVGLSGQAPGRAKAARKRRGSRGATVRQTLRAALEGVEGDGPQPDGGSRGEDGSQRAGA